MDLLAGLGGRVLDRPAELGAGSGRFTARGGSGLWSVAGHKPVPRRDFAAIQQRSAHVLNILWTTLDDPVNQNRAGVGGGVLDDALGLDLIARREPRAGRRRPGSVDARGR